MSSVSAILARLCMRFRGYVCVICVQYSELRQKVKVQTQNREPSHQPRPLMSHTQQMIDTHPNPRDASDTLAACIEACFDCAQVCTTCADACLGEDMLEKLVQCIRFNLDCADICDTTGRVLSRQTKANPYVLRAQLEAAQRAAKTCGDECSKHAAMHEHCRICAETCRQCEQSCKDLASAL